VCAVCVGGTQIFRLVFLQVVVYAMRTVLLDFFCLLFFSLLS
jgi:hypothetical protein